MKYTLTIFKNMFDNKTHRKMSFDSFDGLEKLLYSLSKKPSFKPVKGKSMTGAASLISPASYKEGMTRCNDGVEVWGGWAAMDIDEFIFDGDIKEVLHEKFGKYRYVCYSTASSKPEQPKFRMVFDLGCELPSDDIKAFWYAMNTEFDMLGDRQTKDLSRMYYIPADYPDAYNFIFSNDGIQLDPYDVMRKHPYIQRIRGNSFMDNLPDDVKKTMQEYAEKQLTNTDIVWNSYQDCPFVNKKILMQYIAITDSGWYSRMYDMMVAISGNALRMKYPITANEVADLCRDIDNDNGRWYEKRPLDREADNAIKYAYTRV